MYNGGITVTVYCEVVIGSKEFLKPSDEKG